MASGKGAERCLLTFLSHVAGGLGRKLEPSHDSFIHKLRFIAYASIKYRE